VWNDDGLLKMTVFSEVIEIVTQKRLIPMIETTGVAYRKRKRIISMFLPSLFLYREFLFLFPPSIQSFGIVCFFAT